MKYKVGDKVRVRDDLVVYKAYCHGFYFIPQMACCKGRTVTISRIGDDFYKIKDDIYYCSWADEMFENVKTKHKVGDKVRVRKDLVHGKLYGGQTFYMDDWKGKIVTISSLNSNGYYEIAEDDDRFWWSDEMFEDVAEVDGKIQRVDVGYYLALCHGVLVGVYQDGSHGENSFFTSADGFHQYILPKDAIKWVIPHGK